MVMRYFWVTDQVAQGTFDVLWSPGLENLGDYPTKHHAPAHYIKVHPYYVNEHNYPWFLPCALPPSALQGVC
eukprot:1065356-Ditylum_brightwellii.AAC.1